MLNDSWDSKGKAYLDRYLAIVNEFMDELRDVPEAETREAMKAAQCFFTAVSLGSTTSATVFRVGRSIERSTQ